MVTVAHTRCAQVALLLEWASSQGFEPDVLAGQPVGLLHLSRLQPSADCYELLHGAATPAAPLSRSDESCCCKVDWQLCT